MDEPTPLQTEPPPARTKPRRRRPWEKAFLSALAETGIWQKAVDAAGIARDTPRKLAIDHPDFAAEVAEANEKACDLLEAEARRRAYEGLLRKKFSSKGEPLIDPETGEQYVEREYSDRLIELILRAKKPNEYRDHSTIETVGKVKVEIDRGPAWRP